MMIVGLPGRRHVSSIRHDGYSCIQVADGRVGVVRQAMGPCLASRERYYRAFPQKLSPVWSIQRDSPVENKQKLLVCVMEAQRLAAKAP